MDTPLFTDKTKTPSRKDLLAALGKNFERWEEIEKIVYQKYPAAIAEWNFPGEKYGWSFRMKDKKRAILYFLPGNQFFRVAFVFGQKAVDKIMDSTISEAIKTELQAARVYAEGRGIRIEVKKKKVIKDISAMIDIKLAS